MIDIIRAALATHASFLAEELSVALACSVVVPPVAEAWSTTGAVIEAAGFGGSEARGEEKPSKLPSVVAESCR